MSKFYLVDLSEFDPLAEAAPEPAAAPNPNVVANSNNSNNDAAPAAAAAAAAQVAPAASPVEQLEFREDHYSLLPPGEARPIAKAASSGSLQQQQQQQRRASPQQLTLSDEAAAPTLELPSSAELDWFVEAGDNQREAKRHLMRDFLRERQREFTDYAELTVLCGTWNVNNQFDESHSVADWLRCQPAADVYALGFQEMDLSTVTYITQRSDREDKWTRLILRCLPTSHCYALVKTVRLFSTFLLVVAKDSVRRDIRGVRAGTQATGLMGIGANKGGTAVRFQLGDTLFTFVNCHLAAGEDKLESRYNDLRDIQQKLRLVFDGTAGRYELLSHIGDSAGSHVTFCFGDLNFRLAGVSKEEVERRLRGRQGAVEELLAGHDELRRARAESRFGSVFLSYSEAPIDFWPTYKYELGSQRFDTEKLRVPSWCDRILYRSEAVRCEPTRYASVQDYVLSDHKPVSCSFRTQVARVDPARQRRTLKRGVQWLDSLENAVLPQCVLEPGHEVQFGELSIFDTYRASLTLRNVGRVAASWQLAPKPVGETSGVRATPAESRIPVGASEQLWLDACLGPCQWPQALRRWAAGQSDPAFAPDDVLVVALIGGAHIFVVPRGNITPSCYGAPLACLCRLTDPVLAVEPERFRALLKACFDSPAESIASADVMAIGPPRRPIPAEVSRLLEAADPDAPDLLPGDQGDEDSAAASPAQLAAVADALSRGSELPRGLPASALAHSLLLLLHMLPERRLLPGPGQSQLAHNLLSRVFAWARRVLAGPNRRHRRSLATRLAAALDRPSFGGGCGGGGVGSAGPPSEQALRCVRAALESAAPDGHGGRQHQHQQQQLQQQQHQQASQRLEHEQKDLILL